MNLGSEGWISTEPSTQVQLEREKQSRPKELVNMNATEIVASTNLSQSALARIVPQNRPARTSFHKLASSTNPKNEYHRQFIYRDPRLNNSKIPEDSQDCFLVSLDKPPEFPQLGWGIGRGNAKLPNYGVDIFIPDGEEVAGHHGRLCWMPGLAGFFLVADNLRGKTITLNGEVLRDTRRVLPFRNQLLLGECLYSVHFIERSASEEEAFRLEL
jgi:hypothetical protein